MQDTPQKHAVSPKGKIGIWVFLIALALIGGLVFFKFTNSSPPETQTAAERAIPVQTVYAETGSLKKTLHYTGTVQPDHEVKIAPKIMGRIVSKNVDVGSRVTKGQELVRLDSSSIKAKTDTLKEKIKNAEREVQYLQNELERIKTLHEQQVVSQKKLDDMTYKYDMAKGKLKQLKSSMEEAVIELDSSVLFSPVNGTVTKVMQYEGDMAAPGKPILVVAATERLYTAFNLYQKELGDIEKGSPVILSTGSEKEYSSHVEMIYPSTDPLTRTTVAKAPIPRGMSEKESIKTGSSLDISLIMEQKEDCILIPKEALLETTNEDYVYLVANEKSQKQTVKTGIRNEKFVEITSGLKKGDMIAVTNLSELSDGASVYLYGGGNEI